MARLIGLIGQFLLLGQDWDEYYKKYLTQMLQFVPTMNLADNREYNPGDEYTTRDGKKWKVVRVVGDWDGLLSALMCQVMIDSRGAEVPAMQSLAAVMQEAYDHGARDTRNQWYASVSEVNTTLRTALDAKQKELDNTIVKLGLANGRVDTATQTIAALTNQLKDAKKTIAMLLQAAQGREGDYREDGATDGAGRDSARARDRADERRVGQVRQRHERPVADRQ